MDFILGRNKSIDKDTSGLDATFMDTNLSFEKRLEAAIEALALSRSLLSDRASLLEEVNAENEKLQKTNIELRREVEMASEKLKEATIAHRREIEELEEKYGDEDGDRYVQDLEKELKQWRKLGSQGGQQMIQPVQSAKLEPTTDASNAAKLTSSANDEATSNVRAAEIEAALTEERSARTKSEARLNETIATLKKELSSAESILAFHKREVKDLELQCSQLNNESGYRDENLSALYDECRSLREATLLADHATKASDERLLRQREEIAALEGALSTSKGEVESEQQQHQVTQRQLTKVQKELAEKAEAIKKLKLEVTRLVAAPAAKQRASVKPTDIEEGLATGEEVVSPTTDRKTFSAQGAVIQVDLNALYSKISSANSWKAAWQKLRDRQEHVRSLGRTQRFAVGGVIFVVVWLAYVVMSAMILADNSGDDEAKLIARRLIVCESMLQALKQQATTVGALKLTL